MHNLPDALTHIRTYYTVYSVYSLVSACVYHVRPDRI